MIPTLYGQKLEMTSEMHPRNMFQRKRQAQNQEPLDWIDRTTTAKKK